MATSPPKLLRALVDYFQGGAKIYAAGNVYPESDALLLMKARGEAEALQAEKAPKRTKATPKPADSGDGQADGAAGSSDEVGQGDSQGSGDDAPADAAHGSTDGADGDAEPAGDANAIGPV